MPVQDLTYEVPPSAQSWLPHGSREWLSETWARPVGAGADDDYFGAPTTVDISRGQQSGSALNQTERQRRLQEIYDAAIRAGLGDDGARVAQAIAVTEGGLGGAAGDTSSGGSYGAFQFYRDRGQLPNFARAQGITQDQAAHLLSSDPLAGVDWALNGYLGGAIRAGAQQGLTGPQLATYAQQHGQVSVSPERAGQVYNTLFSGGNAPTSSASRPQPVSSVQPAAAERPPVRQGPVAVTFNGQQLPSYTLQNGGWTLAGSPRSQPGAESEPVQAPVGDFESVGPANPVYTSDQDWQNAADRYQQQFGEPLDWSQYDEDPDTYGYVESALGMSRAGEGQDVGRGADVGDDYASPDTTDNLSWNPPGVTSPGDYFQNWQANLSPEGNHLGDIAGQVMDAPQNLARGGRQLLENIPGVQQWDQEHRGGPGNFTPLDYGEGAAGQLINFVPMGPEAEVSRGAEAVAQRLEAVRTGRELYSGVGRTLTDDTNHALALMGNNDVVSPEMLRDIVGQYSEPARERFYAALQEASNNGISRDAIPAELVRYAIGSAEHQEYRIADELRHQEYLRLIEQQRRDHPELYPDTDTGGGQDVGVGAGWWGDDDPFAGWSDALGGFVHGVVGGSFDPTMSYNDPQQDQQLRQQIQQRDAWQSPGEWASQKWQDATQGQNPLYDVPVIGGAARAAGLGLSVAGDALNLPYKAAEYAAGAAGGAGQLVLDDTAGRPGQTMIYDYGALGGQHQYPTPQNWQDVFDPAQATARFEATASPVEQFGIGIGLAPGGEKLLGVVKDAATAAEDARVAQGITHYLDVPAAQGYAEDLGRALTSDVVQTITKASPLIGGGLGAMQGDPNNPDDVGSHLLGAAEGAAAGAALGLGAWKLASIGQTQLQRGAREYRLIHYGLETQDGDATILRINSAGGDLTDEQQARLTVIDEQNAERDRLLKSTYPDYDNLDPNSRARADQKMAILNDEANLAIARADRAPSTSEYPYFHATMQQAARVATDRAAGIDDFSDYASAVNRRINGRDLAPVDNPSELLRMVASTSSEMEQTLKTQYMPALERAGVLPDRIRADVWQDFKMAMTSYDRAVGNLPETAADYLTKDPDYLVKIGVDPAIVNNLQVKKALADSLDEHLQALQEPVGQERMFGTTEPPIAFGGYMTPDGQMAGQQVFKSIADVERTAQAARNSYATGLNDLQNVVDGMGGIPSKQARIREQLTNWIGRSTEDVGAQPLGVTTAMPLPVDDKGVLRGFPTAMTTGDLLEMQNKADHLRATEGDDVADEWLQQATSELWDTAVNGKPIRGETTNPTGFLGTGPLDQVSAETLTNLINQAQRVDGLYNTGTAANWMREIYGLQDNMLAPMLQADEAAHLLAPGTAQTVIDSHGVYGALRKVGDYADATMGARPGDLRVGDDVIDRYYGTNDLVKETFQTDLQHLEANLRAQRENKVFWSMRQLLQPGEDGQVAGDFDKLMVPMKTAELDDIGRPLIDPETGEAVMRFMKPTEAGTQLPAGWGLVTGSADGAIETYRAPDWLAQSFVSMNPGTADKYVQMAGKFSGSNLFRMGVTTLSVPFIFANMARDFQDAFQNSGVAPQFVRNYLTTAVDVFAHGIDDFVTKNADSPLVAALPQALTDRVAGFAGSRADDVGQYLTLGGGHTFTEQMRGAQDAMDVLGFRSDGKVRGNYLYRVMKTPFDLVQAFSQMSELTTRTAVFKALQESGQSSEAAAMGANSATIDFSRGGEFFKTFGTLLPLVNARVQGTLRSVEAFQDDPVGYAHNLTIGAALPAAALYAYNRTLYSDLYDNVAQSEKDRNFIVGYGSLKDDRDPAGKERLLYFKIPKNEMTALVANPLEQMLDTIYHVKHGQTDLTDPQRTERTAGQMWLAQLANMLPVSQNGNTLFDGQAWQAAALDANPLLGTMVQMNANKDDFLDRPIIPDDQMLLPSEFRKGPNGKEAPWAARAVSKVANAIHMPGLWAPPDVAFAVNHLGGTAASTALGSLDKVWDAFAAAGFPLDPFRATSLQDLQIPPGTSPAVMQSYQDALLNQTDFRPWQQQLLSRFYGMSGSGPSVTSKVNMLSPQEKTTWQETLAADQEQKAARSATQEKIDAVYNDADPNVSFQDRYGKIDELRKNLNGALQQTLDDHPKALQTPQARDLFIAALPGVPINIEDYRPSALDSSVPVDALVQRYQNPQGVIMSTMTSQAQQQARALELTKMANEYNVPQSTLRDYIAAAQLDNKLPTLPVPAVYLNKLVTDYIRPPGDRNLDDVQALYQARRDVIDQAAATWQVPKQDLLERVQTRMVGLSDTNPLALSKEHALQMYSNIKDMPQFVDPQGNALGMSGEWAGWSNYLDMWKQAHKDPNAWPPEIKALNEAQANARVAQQAYLFSNPNYYDYQAWFGFGRTLSPGEWTKYTVTGEKPRYTDDPGLNESARRDGLIRQYQTLPAGVQRNALKMQATIYKRLLVPGWEAAMRYDDQGGEVPNLSDLYL